MGVTKTELENLYHLDKEIEDIEREIEQTIKKTYNSNNYVGDSVKDYSQVAKGKILIISGYNRQRYKKPLENLSNQLSVKKERRISEILKIESELDEIPDAEIRRIIRLKYIEKLNWTQLAKRMGPYARGDSMRMKLQRFLKEIDK